MNIIEILNLIHEYREYDDEGNSSGTVRAVDNVTLEVKEGDFVAILGHNGSGKSTLAKHVNGLLMPTAGSVMLLGRSVPEADPIWTVRRDAGMIFQNPDNQIIGASVEEDVAFGPENMGVPQEELAERVAEALSKAGMSAFRMSSPNALSGGQKQRVAIAGMLAMKPRVLLMDEPTAMLDPSGRKEVLRTVHELNREEGITVVLITHYMEEAADADRVIVMNAGKLIMNGTPREVFSRVEELRACKLTVPAMTGPLHTTGSVSLSRRRLTEIIWIPVLVTAGMIYCSVPCAFSFTPNALGIDGPVISASSMAVFRPLRLKVTASSEVTRDLPTPPLPLTTPMTFLTLLRSLSFSRKSSLEGCLLEQLAEHVLQSCVHSLMVDYLLKSNI